MEESEYVSIDINLAIHKNNYKKLLFCDYLLKCSNFNSFSHF